MKSTTFRPSLSIMLIALMAVIGLAVLYALLPLTANGARWTLAIAQLGCTITSLVAGAKWVLESF